MATRTIALIEPGVDRVGIPFPVWRGDPPVEVHDGPYYPGEEYDVEETLAADLVDSGRFEYRDET